MTCKDVFPLIIYVRILVIKKSAKSTAKSASNAITLSVDAAKIETKVKMIWL